MTNITKEEVADIIVSELRQDLYDEITELNHKIARLLERLNTPYRDPVLEAARERSIKAMNEF